VIEKKKVSYQFIADPHHYYAFEGSMPPYWFYISMLGDIFVLGLGDGNRGSIKSPGEQSCGSLHEN